jgi:hypothetical protein
MYFLPFLCKNKAELRWIPEPSRRFNLLFTEGSGIQGRADFFRDQSANLFTFSLSGDHNAGNKKFTPRRARKYCRLLGLP